ncbi:LAETG motif-containing sortase-dependent surface protein [Actinacidiphila sp. bgisy144]|uniref:LAETG motif-containing sortase-dependent surface protein n=1 Tax=Actinacidiphila sp. bgisy144 TaxID=3413791 RepID=UPI003EB84F7A
MSISSRRTSLTVRYVGVASAAVALALGVAGTASACNIKDFSFTGSATCDQQSGNGVITVHDTDRTRPVTITVKDDSGKQVAQQKYTDSGDFTISVPWSAGAHYQVLASVQGYFDNQSVANGVTLPNTECGASAPTSPASPSAPATAPSASPSTSPSTSASSPAASDSPSAVASTSVAAVADTSSPSPSGNLAETGGGSNTGMIAGIAGALVVVGGGAVFGLRRRSASARH